MADADENIEFFDESLECDETLERFSLGIICEYGLF